jgi:predicted SAM-dependent methyltransferase
VFKLLAIHFGLSVETVDLDPELNPDHVASADDLPFDDNTYDCVCAFQMLEHLPYEQALQAFREMIRVANKNIVISLPDSQPKWVYSFHIPKVGQKIIHFPRPRKKIPVHEFNGEHYWEINKKGYPLQKILNDFSQENLSLMHTYRVPEYPYHRFFVYAKNGADEVTIL